MSKGERMPIRPVIVALGLALLAAPFGACVAARLQPVPSASVSAQIYDVVIRNGRVMDPESRFDATRSIGISAGVITAISTEPLAGGLVIDAGGLVVAPGFIDTDGYTENDRLQVLDGVTTVFDIREGTAEVARWYSDREGKVRINYGVGMGYQHVRSEVMGVPLLYERKGPKPSDEQLAEILQRLQRGFDEGAVALGMGNSAQPDPSGWEHVEAFRVAARVGAHVVATLRDDSWPEYGPESNTPANLAQMIGAAALSGATVNIPHFTSSAAGHAPLLLQMIARARAHGLAITAEDSPYIEGVIRIGPGEMDSWSDREIQEIQPMEAHERLTREGYARYRDRAFVAIAHNDLAEPRLKPSLAEALANPHVSVASHGSGGVLTAQGRGHPRTSGTFSRVLGHYVREEHVLSLMEALRKMTLMPAQRFEPRVPAMRNKGRIRVGADADIVAFDAEKIIDRATFQELRPSQGVRHVLVSGALVVRDGVIEERLFAGRPIRAPSSGAERSK